MSERVQITIVGLISLVIATVLSAYLAIVNPYGDIAGYIFAGIIFFGCLSLACAGEFIACVGESIIQGRKR